MTCAIVLCSWNAHFLRSAVRQLKRKTQLLRRLLGGDRLVVSSMHEFRRFQVIGCMYHVIMNSSAMLFRTNTKIPSQPRRFALTGAVRLECQAKGLRMELIE